VRASQLLSVPCLVAQRLATALNVGLCRRAAGARMVQPLSKPKIIKKFGHKKFKRHQHDRKIAVKVRAHAHRRGDAAAVLRACCLSGS